MHGKSSNKEYGPARNQVEDRVVVESVHVCGRRGVFLSRRNKIMTLPDAVLVVPWTLIVVTLQL